MNAVDDLRAMGATVDDPVAVAAFIAELSLSGKQQARLLRDYLRETKQVLTREIMVAARDYSYYF